METGYTGSTLVVKVKADKNMLLSQLLALKEQASKVSMMASDIIRELEQVQEEG